MTTSDGARGPIAKTATPKQKMARKTRTKTGHAIYSRRKAIVEPVFGQIDTVQDARQLLPRGKPAARAQWRFSCAVHNLLKLHRNGGVEGEGFDLPDLSLPWGQDAVIDAVASANPNTIVVLEAGNPVAMPWRDKASAIVEAWYPSQAGGQAIAEVLTGTVNPSGRLPITFPADLAQTPRPELPGLGTPWGTPTTIEYDEAAEVGYRRFANKREQPLYAFGHGVGYTDFAYSDLEVNGGDTITASFTVTNTGERDGAGVPQLYLTEAAGDERMRLLGFERVELQPGGSRSVTVTADPRLLARYDADAGRWHITEGAYRIALGKAADDLVLTAETQLTERRFGR